jgi:hypothetical protein
VDTGEVDVTRNGTSSPSGQIARGGYIPGGPVPVTLMPGEEIIYPDGRIYKVTSAGLEYVRTDPAVPAYAERMLDRLREMKRQEDE